MSSSSLAKMTPNGGGTLTMPKLQFRWQVRFDSFGGGVLGTGLPGFGSPVTYNAIEMSRPKANFPEIPVHMYNTLMYMPGKINWDPITLKIKDDSNNGVTNDVAQQLRKQIDFQDQNPSINFATMGRSGDFKFVTHIDMLDGTDTVIEKWNLNGCYLMAASYDSINYATSDVMTVTLTIRFDNARQYGGYAELDLASNPSPVSAVDSDT